ncbi:translation initiation factor eIF-2B subunit gamma [Microdochium nivale]|nr:translation initiation factor eIF-2B subunit gamma [Microdochium nivale]
MPHAVSMPATGLQAIILCGPGSSFPTFTANPDEHPKALLPIANRPMVWYPIEFCYRMGITNTTIICPPSAEKAMSTALHTNPFLTSLPYPRPDLLAPKDLDQNTGTAEILRFPEVRELITSDFVILPCDLVCELGGDKLLQAWMVHASSQSDLLSDGGASTQSGGLGVWYDTKAGTPVKGEETDFVATTPVSKRTTPAPKDSLLSHLSNVALSMPTDSLKDLADEKSGLPIRHGLLRKHPKLQMLTSHRDAHIYILPRWIMDFIQQNERLESIGEDVIGWWAKATWQDGLSKKLAFQSVLGGDTPTGVQSPSSPSHLNEMREGTLSPEIGVSRAVKIPKMLAYVHPSDAEAPLIRRVDTAQLLLSVSLQIAKLPSLEETGPENASPFAHVKKIAYPEGVKSRTTITRQDSLVADNVMIEEKTTIKECVIGTNCQIREGAKLFQCVLMDGVTVGKGCKLTRCILGKRSEIGEGSTLTECEVQENLMVEAKTEDKDMKFMSSSGLEASEQEIEAAMADQDGDDEAVGDDSIDL